MILAYLVDFNIYMSRSGSLGILIVSRAKKRSCASATGEGSGKENNIILNRKS